MAQSISRLWVLTISRSISGGGEILNAPIVISAARGSRVIYPLISHLVVYLDGKAKAKYGPYIRVVDLAMAACEYWSKESSVQPSTNAP